MEFFKNTFISCSQEIKIKEVTFAASAATDNTTNTVESPRQFYNVKSLRLFSDSENLCHSAKTISIVPEKNISEYINYLNSNKYKTVLGVINWSFFVFCLIFIGFFIYFSFVVVEDKKINYNLFEVISKQMRLIGDLQNNNNTKIFWGLLSLLALISLLHYKFDLFKLYEKASKPNPLQNFVNKFFIDTRILGTGAMEEGLVRDLLEIYINELDKLKNYNEIRLRYQSLDSFYNFISSLNTQKIKNYNEIHYKHPANEYSTNEIFSSLFYNVLFSEMAKQMSIKTKEAKDA